MSNILISQRKDFVCLAQARTAGSKAQIIWAERDWNPLDVDEALSDHLELSQCAQCRENVLSNSLNQLSKCIHFDLLSFPASQHFRP